MNYQINANKHGGLNWSVDINGINYERFKNFINDIINTTYTHFDRNNFSIYNGYKNRIEKQDIDNINMLLTDDGKIYFNLIKKSLSEINTADLFNIENINSYQRLIIYLICKIFKLTYETIKTTEKFYVPCTDFLPCNKGKSRDKHQTKDFYEDELVCGCEFAPSWFGKNHFDNNYDDTISYSWTYRTRKTGIKIIKN